MRPVEVCDLLNGPVGKSGQDLIQVFADRDPEGAAAFDHGADCGHPRSGLLAADLDPVFQTNGTPRMEFSARFL